MIDKTIYDFETVQGLKTIEIVCSDISVMKTMMAQDGLTEDSVVFQTNND